MRPRIRPADFCALGAVLAGLLCASCTDCDQTACNEAQSPRGHAPIAQGVAGVIAVQSDSCENDCCKCSFDDAELTLVRTPEPVTQQNVASIVSQNLSRTTISAHRAYARALDLGDYLLCYQAYCATLHIGSGDVFTVNVQLVFGPATLIVFGPHDAEPRKDLVLAAGKE